MFDEFDFDTSHDDDTCPTCGAIIGIEFTENCTDPDGCDQTLKDDTETHEEENDDDDFYDDDDEDEELRELDFDEY